MAFPDDFSHDEIFLALCIREEALDDPAAWCAAFRELAKAKRVAPKTSGEAHALMAQTDELMAKIRRNADGTQFGCPG